MLAIVVTVGLSLLSLYVGMAAAGAQQDRAALRRQRGVAKALLAELDRIDAEISRMQQTGLLPYTGYPPVPVPTTIHRWIEGLISQIADEAPDVVGGFMRLEVALVVLAQVTDRARTSFTAVGHAYDDFMLYEERRREDFSAWRHDGNTNRWAAPAPDATMDELPDDAESLLRLELRSPSLKAAAAAKRKWLEAVAINEKDVAEYRSQPLAVRSILIRLQERLYPIARRVIPTLPNLVLKTAIPLVEDAQDAQRADEKALEEFRSGHRQL